MCSRKISNLNSGLGPECSLGELYPLGLLQLLIELLHSLAVFLSQVLDLGLVVPSLLLHGFLQQGHFLLTLRPDRHMNTSRQAVPIGMRGPVRGRLADRTDRSSCCAAVVSRLSSSSVRRAFSSSPRSRRAASTFALAARSASKSSCSSESRVSNSLTLFTAAPRWLLSSSKLWTGTEDRVAVKTETDSSHLQDNLLLTIPESGLP